MQQDTSTPQPPLPIKPLTDRLWRNAERPGVGHSIALQKIGRNSNRPEAMELENLRQRAHEAEADRDFLIDLTVDLLGMMRNYDRRYVWTVEERYGNHLNSIKDRVGNHGQERT